MHCRSILFLAVLVAVSFVHPLVGVFVTGSLVAALAHWIGSPSFWLVAGLIAALDVWIGRRNAALDETPRVYSTDHKKRETVLRLSRFGPAGRPAYPLPPSFWRRGGVAWLLAALVLAPALASPADAGLRRWLRPSTYTSAAASMRIQDEALVLTAARAVGADEREVIALGPFGPIRVRFVASDRGRVARNVAPGSTLELLEVTRVDTADSGEVVIPSRWRSTKGSGNPAAGALGAEWPQVVAMLLRSRPDLLASAFGASPGALLAVERDLPGLHAGLDQVLGVEHPAPEAPAPQVVVESASPVVLFELLDVRATLEAMAAMFDARPDGDHHGIARMARDAINQIDAALESQIPTH